MGTVTLRGTVIGAGRPKLVVPLTGSTRAELAAEAAALAGGAADAAEWRADFYEDAGTLLELPETLAALRCKLENVPLLYTLRTKEQGGAWEAEPLLYATLCAAAAASDAVDAVDVECTDAAARDVIAAVHAAGKPVVGSWHDFSLTPPREAMLDRLRAIREAGADILKLAVMPQSQQDVLALLEATEEAARTLDAPVVTVSMSQLGAVSRVCGGAFGSALTFAAGERASAPGQLPAAQLRAALDMVYGCDCE